MEAKAVKMSTSFLETYEGVFRNILTIFHGIKD
jgi:hypothetical protein